MNNWSTNAMLGPPGQPYPSFFGKLQLNQLHSQLPPQFDSYWNFQSVVFQVERTLFSVWKAGFLVKGTPFETMFSLPTGNTEKAEGSSADKPIVLKGMSTDNFRAFLPVTEYSHWFGVLRLAHKWEFVKIRKKAVDAITTQISLKPVEEKIKMGNQFHVRDWLKQGFIDLILRKDLEIGKLQQSPYNFDQDSIIKVFYIQSKVWQKQDDSHTLYSSFNLMTYINNHVEELFATELERAVYSPEHS